MKQSEKARKAAGGIDVAIQSISLYWYDATSQKDVEKAAKITEKLREIRKEITTMIYT